MADLHLVPCAATDPIFMVPFVHDDKFVGREDILCQIEERLQVRRRVSIAGLGGVGYDLFLLFISEFCTILYLQKLVP